MKLMVYHQLLSSPSRPPVIIIQHTVPPDIHTSTLTRLPHIHSSTTSSCHTYSHTNTFPLHTLLLHLTFPSHIHTHTLTRSPLHTLFHHHTFLPHIHTHTYAPPPPIPPCDHPARRSLRLHQAPSSTTFCSNALQLCHLPLHIPPPPHPLT